jgi:hypothetical protein
LASCFLRARRSSSARGARWSPRRSFFSWSRKTAVKEYVDVLPADVAGEIKERLRD